MNKDRIVSANSECGIIQVVLPSKDDYRSNSDKLIGEIGYSMKL
jgi:hypothetical protein